MLRYNSVPSVIINAEPGIYTFEAESGTGKTFLFSMLCSASDIGLPVVTYTYSDYLRGVNLTEQISLRKPELIMLDRYDRYRFDEKIIRAIDQASETAVVLIDLKNLIEYPLFVDYAGIDFTPTEIEVTG